MKLTGFSKLLLTLLITGLVFFAIKMAIERFGKGGATAQNTQQTTTSGNKAPNGSSDVGGNSSGGSNSTTTSGNAQNTTGNNSGGSATSAATRPAFSYSPAQPTGGKLRGVVELGASGFNSFVVRMDEKKNWKLEKSEFGASLVQEGMASTDDIKTGLKKYLVKMLDFGVSGKDLHFVVSSGAAKSPEVLKIIDALKSIGYVVNQITPEQEGKFALRCVLPDAFKQEAFVVDIGSGNTKISWVDAAGKMKSVEGPGAKYFQKGLADDKVYSDVTAISSQIPIANRKMCFIIGGVPYELAKQDRTGQERYTTLRKPQDYKAEGEKIKSGLNIYKAISDKTGCETYVFDWDANFTIGFLLAL